jgi:hypothetical protein
MMSWGLLIASCRMAPRFFSASRLPTSSQKTEVVRFLLPNVHGISARVDVSPKRAASAADWRRGSHHLAVL